MTIDADTPDAGMVRLEFERDPFEVLQLGTYVGSCLSIQGLCDYSAVAAALDINKRVIYARNRRGSVIARQLVAISNADKLVTYAVFPHSVSRNLKRVFDRYDRDLATHLGIPIADRDVEGDETEVAQVISEEWWDDGPWRIDDEEADKEAVAAT